MKNVLLLTILLLSTLTYSQKKEKVKGSKIVTIEKKQIESFTELEVADNLEIILIKGTESTIEIEADDNLHQAIETVVTGNRLRLSTLKDISSSKKLSVRVTYTDEFNNIIAKNQAKITATSEIQLDEISIRTLDYSKIYINVKTKKFTLQCEDKSKAEFNVKSEKINISLTKNASAKALIAATDLTFDLYQKSEAVIEGDIENSKLRLDNSASFTGKNLSTTTADITTEESSKASIYVRTKATIDAIGKSEIVLYGNQKIEITRLYDSAVLMKKPTK
jgi:hypothetical protein